MILQRLQVENFRQFHGKQTIEFATNKTRNVTLIHGFNGAGKTALLNAFIWCLYGETTEDFEASDLLASEAAIASVPEGGVVPVRVRMTFKLNDGSVYVVDRSQDFVRRGLEPAPQQAQLSLSIQRSGSSELDTVDNAKQQRINTLLAQQLYKFFFFNGERIEWFASAAAYDTVEEGVKSLLDIKIYERSIAHLQDLSRNLAGELKEHGGEELQEAIAELERLMAAEQELTEREKQLHNNIASLETEKETFEREQASIQALAVLAAERDGYRKEFDNYRGQLEERTIELAKAVSSDGYLAFAEMPLKATSACVDAARQRGELPAKIKPQFVNDLLDSRICVCGRPLDEHHHKEVEVLKAWQRDIGLAEHEEAVSKLSAAVVNLLGRRDSCFTRIDDLQGRRSELKAQTRRVQDKLAEIEDKLSDPTAGQRAADLAEQITRVSAELIDRKADLKMVGEKIMDNRARQAEAKDRESKLQAADQQGELIKRRRAAVERLIAVLSEIYELRKQDVREDLSTRISRLWNDAAIKDYEASLTDDFQLKLNKRIGGHLQPVHGASTGEKQVLALSFVGSLVEKARANLEESDQSESEIERGGLYPLVMDSAFGSLEDEYRSKVAQWIPTLANQVILLVSKTQWRNEVEREVRPRVGKEYILELHTTKSDTSRNIDILDSTYPYVVETTDPYERTVIRGVEP
ncbi:AAA family ATPase [Bradyrhizobium sp. USDA 4451]